MNNNKIKVWGKLCILVAFSLFFLGCVNPLEETEPAKVEVDSMQCGTSDSWTNSDGDTLMKCSVWLSDSPYGHGMEIILPEDPYKEVEVEPIFDCPADFNRTVKEVCIAGVPNSSSAPVNMTPQQIRDYFVSRGDVCGCFDDNENQVSNLDLCEQYDKVITCTACAETKEYGWDCRDPKALEEINQLAEEEAAEMQEEQQ